ncbi:hypothetical protein C7271_05980 [filamentous cyanobacterium CCP5]|nr:hypothetical protein C7271_05980 [filamentous cyanobacterium CCP5]
MTHSTLAPITTASTTGPQSPTLETRLKAALEHARRLTKMSGIPNIDVAIAWEAVEELQAAQKRKPAPSPSAFAMYCAANPSAPEARIYDC